MRGEQGATSSVRTVCEHLFVWYCLPLHWGRRMLIRTYGEELVSEEERNNRKLGIVSRAGLLLMIGVVALAGESGILAVAHLAMSAPK